MPKRAATPAGLAPKRAALALGTTTPGGKPRCDRCRKAIFENQISREVNGRIRHRDCWPAHKVLENQWLHEWAIIRDDPMRNTNGTYYNESFNAYLKKWDQLIEKEFMMKAVNCVSKGVREALHRTNEVGLALSDAQ
jgi:hypothetical protein